MNFTPSKETKQNAYTSLHVYLGYVRSKKSAADIISDYNLLKQGRKIDSESEKIISNCLLELEILTK